MSNEWISVTDRLPEILETVWISNGNGWTTLGCRSDYFSEFNDDGREELCWCWCVSNGIIWEKNGKITSDCEADDFDVIFWMPLPKPPKQPKP